MPTLTVPARKQPAPQQAPTRYLKIVRDFVEGAGRIRIRTLNVRGEWVVREYEVRRLHTDASTTAKFRRADTGEVYLVTVSGEGAACCCWSHARSMSESCKHSDALAVLVRRNKFDDMERAA